MTERLYHDIMCPTLTKAGSCNCAPVIVSDGAQGEAARDPGPHQPPKSDDRAELLRAVRWIQDFSAAHHAGEPAGVHLHRLIVDIPDYLGYVIAILEKDESEAARDPGPPPPELDTASVQLLAWAVTNCHMLARRALARTTSVYDREKWEHVLRICEKAGARSQGVLRAGVPTELTEGAKEAAGDPGPPETLSESTNRIRERIRNSARPTAEDLSVQVRGAGDHSTETETEGAVDQP